MLKPLGDKIVVKREEKSNTTESGIMLVNDTKEKSRNTIAGNRGNEGIQQIDKKRNKLIYKIQKEI